MTNNDLFKNIDNSTELTEEEGYELIKFYVHYFWVTNKFYSLRNEYEEEDVVSVVTLKCLKSGHFGKYNNKITSKKYHIMNAVRTTMIDLIRRYREQIYLDSEIEEGMTYGDVLPDESHNTYETATGSSERDRIIAALPDTTRSKIRGFSPLFNQEVNISFKNLALHLEAGYTVKDMSEFYKNPDTGENISASSISNYVNKMREWILDNVVIA